MCKEGSSDVHSSTSCQSRRYLGRCRKNTDDIVTELSFYIRIRSHLLSMRIYISYKAYASRTWHTINEYITMELTINAVSRQDARTGITVDGNKRAKSRNCCQDTIMFMSKSITSIQILENLTWNQRARCKIDRGSKNYKHSSR